MCRVFIHTWPTCTHNQIVNSIICEQGLYRIEYLRQQLKAGGELPGTDELECSNWAVHTIGDPQHPCPQCIAGEAVTLELVEARLRSVSGPRGNGPEQGGRTQEQAQAEAYLREERAFALLDDEYERISGNLRIMEEQGRRIQDAEETTRDLPPGTPNHPSQLDTFSFNPQTAEHGSFIPGAGRWLPDRRSMSQRYRDGQLQQQRRNRPSGLSQVITADDVGSLADLRNGHSG